MTRYPSVNRIAEWFPYLERDEARAVRRVMDGTADPEDFDAGRKRINECFHRPTDLDLKLTVIDDLIGGFGTECITTISRTDRFGGPDLVAEYVNMGDSYHGTVLFDHDRGTWCLTTWGDWCERAERGHRFRIGGWADLNARSAS